MKKTKRMLEIFDEANLLNHEDPESEIPSLIQKYKAEGFIIVS